MKKKESVLFRKKNQKLLRLRLDIAGECCAIAKSFCFFFQSDVFGQPLAAGGQADMTWGTGDVTRRRWINQEDLADAHLIDLNARVYDPLLGKFMSPNPVIANQDDSQSWNAYAYSHNNPMSKEDPTGLESDENPACKGSCGNGTPPGKDLGHGVSYDPQHNVLYVPKGTSASVASAIAGAVQGGAARAAGAGASETSTLSVSPGLSGQYHVGKLASPNGVSTHQEAQLELMARPPVIMPDDFVPRPGWTPLDQLPKGSGSLDEPGAGKDFKRATTKDYPEGTPCTYCRTPTTRERGPRQLQRDHVRPRVQGGNSDDENRAPACRTCNLQKGGGTPQQWYQRIWDKAFQQGTAI